MFPEVWRNVAWTLNLAWPGKLLVFHAFFWFFDILKIFHLSINVYFCSTHWNICKMNDKISFFPQEKCLNIMMVYRILKLVYMWSNNEQSTNSFFIKSLPEAMSTVWTFCCTMLVTTLFIILLKKPIPCMSIKMFSRAPTENSESIWTL